MGKFAGGPAKGTRGQQVSGPLSVAARDRKHANTGLRITDEGGIIQPPNTLSLNYYPASFPAASAGTPTNGMCQALCRMLAPLIAQDILTNSTILRLVHRQLLDGNPFLDAMGNLASTTVNGRTENLSTFSYYSETVPVDVVLANDTLMRDVANRLACQLANRVDADIAGLYPFATAPVGTGAVALTDATIRTAIGAIGNTGEPLLLFAHPYNFGLNHGFSLAQNPFAEPIVWSGMSNGPGTISYGSSVTARDPGCYIIPCSQVVRNNTPVANTNHNFMITPSAVSVLFGLVADMNGSPSIDANFRPITNIVNAQACAAFENVAVTVFCVNTGSGAQTIYASILYGLNLPYGAVAAPSVMRFQEIRS
jgi:hypothetical protein